MRCVSVLKITHLYKIFANLQRCHIKTVCDTEQKNSNVLTGNLGGDYNFCIADMRIVPTTPKTHRKYRSRIRQIRFYGKNLYQ